MKATLFERAVLFKGMNNAQVEVDTPRQKNCTEYCLTVASQIVHFQLRARCGEEVNRRKRRMDEAKRRSRWLAAVSAVRMEEPTQTELDGVKERE